MKVSVSSYSFYQYVNAGKMSLTDCVGKAKEMGFDAIEFVDLDEDGTFEAKAELARKIRAEADRLGMEINAYTVGAQLCNGDEKADEEAVETLKKQLGIAQILGAKVMRHDVCYTLGNGIKRSFDRMLPCLAKNARRVTEYAETLGIRTCSENHGFIAQDSERVERLFNAVAHDNYGLLVDIGNFLCVDEDPATAVSRVAPYAFHVHVKDFGISEVPTPVHTLMTRGARYLRPSVIGEGDVPVKRCLAAIKRTGYDGFVSIEYEGVEDCITAIERGLKNLKSILSEI